MDCEVIYVDSASQDNTVEIASRFPIRILQLQPTWRLTPSAGRYIGYQHASGKYLLFVDGDTVLNDNWLKASCDFLKTHPEFGGVGGVMDEAYEGPNGEVIAVAKNSLNQNAEQQPQIVTSLPGIATYRRAAMETSRHIQSLLAYRRRVRACTSHSARPATYSVASMNRCASPIRCHAKRSVRSCVGRGRICTTTAQRCAIACSTAADSAFRSSRCGLCGVLLGR